MKSKSVSKNIELNYHNPLTKGLHKAITFTDGTIEVLHFSSRALPFDEIEQSAQKFLDSTENPDCSCDFCKRARKIIELCKF